MVDHWLIAAGKVPYDVLRVGQDYQKGDKRNADAESNFLRPLTQGPPKHGLTGIEEEVAPV